MNATSPLKPAEATEHTRALLEALEIAPADAAKKLVDLPMEALVEGAKKVSSLWWAPVADGRQGEREDRGVHR